MLKNNNDSANQGIDEISRNFTIEFVRVTESAALASYKLMGKGDEMEADRVAVAAMRKSLNNLPINGTIVIGEGERDKAPMLYIGEKVGTGEGPAVDIALDPLEGTTICANGQLNSMTVLAVSSKGLLLYAPDVYMNKIAVSSDIPNNVVDLDETPKTNLKALAKAKKCNIEDLVVCVLQRERHKEMISKIREAGARVKLIQDGDVAGVIATTNTSKTGIDLYMGIGGAPEGVLAAAALRCIGGHMQGRLIFDNDDQKERARRMNIKDLDYKYSVNEMAKGNVIFAATGVTEGTMLDGVKVSNGRAFTHSIVMRSETQTIRNVKASHIYNHNN